MSLTWSDIIRLAHVEIGVRESDEPIAQHEQDDAEVLLRGMLREFAIDGLIVPGLARLTHTLESTKRIYTIGADGLTPAADIVSANPIETITALRYKTAGSLDYCLMEQTSYGFLSQNTSDYAFGPTMFYYEQGHPRASIYFNAKPIDGDAIELTGRGHFASFSVEDRISDTVPEGYAEALRLNLACKIAPSFGIDGTSRARPIEQRAMKALETIRSRNVERPESPLDPMYLQGNGESFGSWRH